jgi:HD-GYP domain-containing protein (c-di-GMP phosphodiesterase class II)
MHDIGKVSVPSEILLKNDKLTDEEYEIIKKHSLIGYNILKTLTTTKEIGKYVLHHHEWWDGAGYPNKLKGKEIPLISRIVSIVDAYVVMIDGRPYKEKKSKIEAINELKICSGTQFDPELTNIFIEIIESD